jgi:hypothetical protein
MPAQRVQVVHVTRRRMFAYVFRTLATKILILSFAFSIVSIVFLLPCPFWSPVASALYLQKELPKFSVEKKFHFLVIYVA